ncbi:hypothetical protein CYY_007848 [Polysphondylium violaceum]|uniref:Uncharacterized protein n=1 Tax=Polysphondylium violaceum TaxID=133409 RepID=A0A8J4PP20_9MYCE|nr:hypothetical protein CYY_007848 [Polysphondylium violaceum]
MSSSTKNDSKKKTTINDQEQNSVKIYIDVRPNAKESSIESFQDNVLSVRIDQPPIDGAANKELIEFLSKELSIKKRNINLDKGSKSRNKLLVFDIENESITKDQLFQRIENKLK